MSNQNPMHRDRGRRDDGEQPYTDARERLAENEARIEGNAPFPEDATTPLTDEEQKKLEEEAAENRFDKIGQDVNEERNSSREDHHGN